MCTSGYKGLIAAVHLSSKLHSLLLAVNLDLRYFCTPSVDLTDVSFAPLL